MSSKIKVLLIGANGETGSDVLEGLLEDGTYHVTIFCREESRTKPAVKALEERGLSIAAASSDASVEELAKLLETHQTSVVISAIGPLVQMEQLKWIDAAVLAKVDRFIPCGFTTIAPRGGIMLIRDEKEEVHDHLFRQKLPFSIVDVGFWYQISFFDAPSGRLSAFSSFPNVEIYGDGDAPNLLIDKRDIGRYIARIAKDERTLNKRVAAYGAELSQNQIVKMMEKVLDEKLQLTHVSEEELVKRLSQAVDAYKQAGGNDLNAMRPLYINQYSNSKYVRKDNSLVNAKYLGYLDAHELYPDFKPISLETFLGQMLAGEGKRPYENLNH